MRKEFFVGRLLSGSYLVLGVVATVWGVFQITRTPTPTRVGIGILFLVIGAWNLYGWRLMTRAPVIAVTDDVVEVRAPLARRAARIPRADSVAVAWSNPGGVGLRLRSGAEAVVPLAGLARRDKAAVSETLASWCGVPTDGTISRLDP